MEHEIWVIYRAGCQKRDSDGWLGGTGTERMLKERDVNRRHANIK